jgi:glycerophosphoryl diester phosphodiesterase
LKFTLHHDWLVNIEIKNLGDTPGNRTIVEQVMEMVVALDMLDRVLVSSFRHDYLRRAQAACPEVLTGALVDREHPDPPALLEDLGTFSYHPKTSAICFNDIHALRDRGIPVLVWTANDTATMKALIRAGASGIFTDFPQILHSCIHLQNREKLP